MSTRKSFKLPKSIEVEMSQRVIKDGYGMRGRSRWICDAIKLLLSLDDDEFIIDCVENVEQMADLDTTISYRTSDIIEDLVNEWVVKVRLHNPMKEGVRSKIYRASIIQGLLGSIQTISQFKKTSASLRQNTPNTINATL